MKNRTIEETNQQIKLHPTLVGLKFEQPTAIS